MGGEVMAKIPYRKVIDGAKEYGPKAGKFIKENWKEIGGAFGALSAGGKAVNDFRKEKKEEKLKQGKIHHRKAQYYHYKSSVLQNLDNKNKNELFDYILEIEKFIQQIKQKEDKELGVKKPIHTRRINNWNEILIQIQDKMYTKDYHEFLKIFNDPNYESEYFKGFEVLVENFKKLINSKKIDELLDFISKSTNMSETRIKRDFSL